MITGPVLVLLTWAFVVAVLFSLGLLPALVSQARPTWPATFRHALWWGLGIAVALVLIINLWLPLRSAAAAVVFLGFAALMGIAAYITMRARPLGQSTGPRAGIPGWMWLFLAALVIGVVYLAVAAMGPVTNYDTGLYHLGAIGYAGDYSTISGLANLHSPFGYNTSQFPLAAVLGNGPWGGVGYRLLNGFVMVLVVIDLAVRMVSRRYSVGTCVLLVGTAAAWVPMIALSDYWMTSPTSDSAVFLLTIVAGAYLADALWMGRQWWGAGSTALVVALVLVTLRPLMGFFLVGLVAALAASASKRRRSGQRPPTARLGWILVVALAIVLGIVQSARDYLLSGWLQYPLSIFAFSVPWRAPDPINDRTATLGNARDPANLWDAAVNWDWIPVWIGRLPLQWETYEFLALAVAVLIALVLAARVGRPARPRALALAVLPSALTVLVWFVASPPSFRFAWGPVFSLATIPLGWALFLLARAQPRRGPSTVPVVRLVIAGFVAVTVVLVGYCSVARLDLASVTESGTWALGPLSVGYRVTPLPLVPTNEQQLASGLTVHVPVDGENCWGVFPLCVPRISGSVGLRSDSIQGGFLP